MVRDQGSSSVSNGVVRHNCRVAAQFSVEFWRSPGQACTLECWSSQISVVFPAHHTIKRKRGANFQSHFHFSPSPRPSSPSLSLGLSRCPRLRFHSHITHTLPWILTPPSFVKVPRNQSTSTLFLLVNDARDRHSEQSAAAAVLSNKPTYQYARVESTIRFATSPPPPFSHYTTYHRQHRFAFLPIPLFIFSVHLGPVDLGVYSNDRRSNRPILEKSSANSNSA